MYTAAEIALHTRIRETYVRERRAFESRLSGAPSGYGLGHMPKWDGTDDDRPGLNRKSKSDRFGRSFKPIWPKIAEFAFKHSVDPLLLVRNRFLNTRGPRPPEPTECMCQKALELCLADRVSPEELNSKLCLYQDIFQKEVEGKVNYVDKYGWTPQRVIDSVVRDLTLPFSSLYRYYLATVNGIGDVAEKHRSAAVLEYLRDMRSYSDSLWSQVIPADISSEAALSVN